MSKNRLMIEMTIFAALLFVICSLVVINDKSKDFLIPKVDQKLNNYISKNYKGILEDVKINKTTYNKKTSTFMMKVEHKENKNLYFTIFYKNKKITSTYKEDYLEGKTLLTTLKKNLEKDIPSKKNQQIKIQFIKKLNEYNSLIYESLIKEKEVATLEIYNINIDMTLKEFNKQTLYSSIDELYQSLNKENFHPKYYNIEIIDLSNITQELKINQLTDDLITNHLEDIIDDVISNNPKVKEKWNIEVEYTN